MAIPTGCCEVCLGRFTPHEPAESPATRGRRERAHPACAELAVFLTEWLHDGTLTYAQVWRSWELLRDRGHGREDLARGMRLAAGMNKHLSVLN